MQSSWMFPVNLTPFVTFKREKQKGKYEKISQNIVTHSFLSSFVT